MALPTFIVAGAARSGTTALFTYLRHHPEVHMSPVKEPNHFLFDQRFPPMAGPEAAWIRATSVLAPLAYERLFEAGAGIRARGEASPLYMAAPEAAARIHRAVPDVRLVFVLRDPAERAFSHHQFMTLHGAEPLSFTEALTAEPERRRTGWIPSYWYVGLGHYHHLLQPYLRLFGRHQVFIGLYDDFCSQQAVFLQDLFRFIGVSDAVGLAHLRTSNVSGSPRSQRLHAALHRPHPVLRRLTRLVPLSIKRPLVSRLRVANTRRSQMNGEVRAHLIDRFRDDILRLQDLLDRDLSAWLTP